MKELVEYREAGQDELGNPHEAGWGFWDETDANWTGGYPTKEEAIENLFRYQKEVLG